MNIYKRVNINSFYVLNILSISCRLKKMNEQSLNFGPKLPFWVKLGIWLAFEKKNKILSHLKPSPIFQKANFGAKLRILIFRT